jgi:tetratricopeptide (TPR) repeat protein
MDFESYLSYYRPLTTGQSWSDYLRATQGAEVGAAIVREHIERTSYEQVSAIREASQEQVSAIKEASRQNQAAIKKAAEMQALAHVKIAQVQVEAIQRAAKLIGFQLENNQKELSFLNRRMDIVIEQNRLGFLLQQNIAELLKIPDSEKERQQAITLGIKFFINASKDPDLYDDALEELLRAEKMMKQDYFVLHRIGCIYLFVEKHMDIPKARDYFVRAGKYASVESDSNAVRLVNLLNNSITEEYTKGTSDTDSIKLLAADSYEKAALASYILGDDEKAIEYQKKAVSFNSIPENRFKLCKYLIRGGKVDEAIKQLDCAINKKPEIMEAILCDVDTAGSANVIELLEKKVQEIDIAVEEALEIVLCGEKADKSLANDLFKSEHTSYVNRAHLVNRVVKL